MKLPWDVSGNDLIKALRTLGYSPTRQSGSHVRLTTEENGTHHITIPQHDPIKLGTLSSILDDIANHHKISRNELLLKLRF